MIIPRFVWLQVNKVHAIPHFEVQLVVLMRLRPVRRFLHIEEPFKLRMLQMWLCINPIAF
jgi:hypothetical protein